MRSVSFRSLCFGLLVAGSLSIGGSSASAAEIYGLTPGTVELQSAGPMAFGPSGVLFVGDPKAAKVYGINTEDSGKATVAYEISDVTAAVSTAFDGKKIEVVDLAVNPETGNAFLSLTAGGQAHLAKITPDGKVTPLNLDKVGHAVATLPNPPEDKTVKRGRRSSNARDESITDVAYVDGRILVSGLAGGEVRSTVREFDFPFRDQSSGMEVEIYHAAHGKNEDNRAVQTFVPINIGGEPSLLAGYQCTPLVKIPITKIKSSSKVKGTTVAELGNRNRPLDMIVYKQGGKDYLLMANSERGVMKISTDNLERENGLSERVKDGATAGQSYETIEALDGVVQLDRVDDVHALVMIQRDATLSLETIDLP